MNGRVAGSRPALLGWAVLGWAVTAGALVVARPLFGVVSVVTWTLTWAGWAGAVAGSVYATARLRSFPARAVAAGSAALAVAALLTVGPPARTAETLYKGHRTVLDRLAGDFRAGRISDDRALPLRLRVLTVDGLAHPRCGSRTPPVNCGLFLLLEEDWRGERGAGIAYFGVPPATDQPIVTAPGDVGLPARELGGGWWLID